MNDGAKIIWLWNTELHATGGDIFLREYDIINAHYHANTLINNPEVTFTKHGSSMIIDAFDPQKIGPYHVLHQVSYQGVYQCCQTYHNTKARCAVAGIYGF